MPCADLEAGVGRLLKLLTVILSALGSMTELAIQADLAHKPGLVDRYPEKEKQEALALYHRRIDAAVNRYKDGHIEYEEYRDLIETNEREIAHWESRTTETEKIGIELAMCMDVINNMTQMWDTPSPEDKQAMARGLFEYLVHDPDIQRITDFTLKP